MKHTGLSLSAGLLLSLSFTAAATTLYVDVSNPAPAAPYTNWVTAATNIQNAVDAAVAGDQIMVTNGVYKAGGRVVYGSMSNRVAVTKPVTVQSINGAAATVIQGHQVPGTTNGDSAVRCVYLANGAVLSGFTLTNGATRATSDVYQERSGGGVWCASLSTVVSNCVIAGNSALNDGGGAFSGTLANCILTGNSALDGGGGYSNTLIKCTLIGNYGSPSGGGYGGGTCYATLTDCTLTANLASSGGAAAFSTLTNCSLTGNWAGFSGGGSHYSTLANSTLTGNSSSTYGGGANYSTLNNCALSGNSSSFSGGGVESCTLANCAVTGNWAFQQGGGADSSTLNNCIVYFNTASMDPTGTNYSGSTLNYCCAAPLPASGVGNLAADPQLAGPWQLSAGSPCRGAGNAGYAAGLDIDGAPWAHPPSMGCDEFWDGAATGALGVSIQAPYTNVAAGFTANFVGNLTGNASASAWDFSDGTVVSNRPYASHAWAVAGDYTVVLRVYNDSYPAGVTATILVHVVTQPVHYVALASVSPAPPYASWATAAKNIQDAVDAAEAGATVLVSNGVYGVGGRVVYGSMTNRLAVTKPLIVRSVNGAAVTAIQGHQVPGTTNGDSAARCVYMGNGAVLSGFTLTNGATRATGDFYQEQFGGGVWCASFSAVVSNCVVVGNSAYSRGGGACYGTVANCTLTGNSASSYGGAAYSATLNNCTLASNSASQQGGGSYAGTLANCTLTGNWAPSGGGTYSSTLTSCTLTGNSASSGGGAYSAMLNNCILTGNSASSQGGGAYSSTLAGCALACNSALNGGGTYSGTLTNCTITGNSASFGGGAYSSTLNNCIVYFNTASLDPVGTNYSGGTLNYCCAAPWSGSGAGNIATDPQLAGPWHLSAGSPCRGVGNAGCASGVDIDGEPWANLPSIGCDEFWAGAATGALGVSMQASYTNVATGFTANFVGNITGYAGSSFWDFGDETVVSNRPYASHAWATAGDYTVVLRAYNNSYPAGVTATIQVHVVTQPVHYVALASLSPAPPYTSWATAATNIQDAVDAAAAPGAMVLVSNGVYGVGGRVASGTMTSRVAVIKPVVVQSVNGATVTVIQGYQVPGNNAVRCAYLTNGAVLAGFTLTKGATRGSGDQYQEQSGGGIWCVSLSAVVSNCVIVGNSAQYDGGGAYHGTLANCSLTGNSAYQMGGAVYASMLNNCTLTSNSASSGGGACSSTLNNCTVTSNSVTGMYGKGGGADGGTLNNCVLTGNSAPYGGGGAADSATLNNCTVTRNSASQYGGGAYYATLNNCILYYNTAPTGSNYLGGTNNYCCTAPSPGTGPGNFTNAPLFVDQAAGNLRLQTNSPCVNAGNDAYAPGLMDLDGNPRIVGGTVDVGAYECQSPALLDYYVWLQGHGLPTDASAVYADSDGDGMNNWQEWLAGTNPTNAASVLQLQQTTVLPAGVTLTWTSVTNRAYFVERTINLMPQPAFSLLQTNIPGLPGTTSFTDTNPPPSGPAFYRVGVQQ
jgi:hypothetical protein